MYHRLASIAESHHADETEFTAFALENHERFHIIIESGKEPLAGTFWINDLVDAFFAAGHSRLPSDEWRRRYGWSFSS